MNTHILQDHFCLRSLGWKPGGGHPVSMDVSSTAWLKNASHYFTAMPYIIRGSTLFFFRRTEWRITSKAGRTRSHLCREESPLCPTNSSDRLPVKTLRFRRVKWYEQIHTQCGTTNVWSMGTYPTTTPPTLRLESVSTARLEGVPSAGIFKDMQHFTFCAFTLRVFFF